MNLTKEQKQRIIDLAVGYKGLKLRESNWYDTTLCISTEPYRTQIDSDGVYREYKVLVRFLHTTKERKMFMIDVVDCGTNTLDQFPDNSRHIPLGCRNQYPILKILMDAGAKIDWETERLYTA